VKSNEREKFAEAVRQLRGKRSIREFAKILGLSHAIIRAWENPKSSVYPEKKNIEKIAVLRGETYSEFMSHLENPGELPDSFERLLLQVQNQAPVLSPSQISKILRILADYLDFL